MISNLFLHIVQMEKIAHNYIPLGIILYDRTCFIAFKVPVKKMNVIPEYNNGVCIDQRGFNLLSWVAAWLLLYNAKDDPMVSLVQINECNPRSRFNVLTFHPHWLHWKDVIFLVVKAPYRRTSFLWQVFMWQFYFARLYVPFCQFFLWQVHFWKASMLAFEQVDLS